MIIGIIGAMEKEVAILKEQMEISEVVEKASMTFCKGMLCGKEVVVVRSGIGKVNAAICAQILVDRFGVDLLINTGIAGSLNAAIDIGDIVISKDAVQHDVDIHTFTWRIASGDQFIAESEVKQRITERFGADCVEMEGASIAHAAYLNKIPCVILRAISDKADNSAEMDYPAFEQKAIEHSVRLVQNLLPRL